MRACTYAHIFISVLRLAYMLLPRFVGRPASASLHTLSRFAVSPAMIGLRLLLTFTSAVKEPHVFTVCEAHG